VVQPDVDLLQQTDRVQQERNQHLRAVDA
jgi:hypothetical protein